MNKLDDRVFNYIKSIPDHKARREVIGVTTTYNDGMADEISHLMPVIELLISCVVALESKDVIQRFRTLDDLRLFLIDKGE